MVTHHQREAQSTVNVCMLLLGLCSVCQAAGLAGPGHHIYREGKWAGSCTADDFVASYWTDRQADSEGTQLLGTVFAQRVIHRHQHPAACAAAQFLLYKPCHLGIGANIHVMGQVLSLALRLGRVMVLESDDAHPYFDLGRCDPALSHHECYFEPASSCTLADVDAALGAGVPHSAAPALKEDKDAAVMAAERAAVANAPVVAVECFAGEQRAVPDVFADFLAASALEPAKAFYWWRAQASAFLVRPNARTLAEVERRKAAAFPPVRVAARSISMHVRRGDKWVEAAATEDAQYLRAAEAVHLAGAAAHGLRRSIFLSTEDPAAIAFFQALPAWNTSFAEVPRKPDTTKSTLAYTAEFGPGNEMLNSLVNLDLALQCDAFIGTLSSNWCRLIDELRSTVRCKADKLYLDAQQAYPPPDLSF